jgi:hypothetical protein
VYAPAAASHRSTIVHEGSSPGQTPQYQPDARYFRRTEGQQT